MEKILVVDDEPVICAALERLLAFHWQVASATSATDALTAVASQTPDLLLVDWTLGAEMNGLELADEVRKNHPGMPVIIMTGDPSSVVLELVACTANTSLVAKPCPYDQLIAAIEDALANAQSGGQIEYENGETDHSDTNHSASIKPLDDE